MIWSKDLDRKEISWISEFNIWFRSTMDSISDSDSEDAGSIPAGTTRQESASFTRSFLLKILLKSSQNADYIVLFSGSTNAIFDAKIFREYWTNKFLFIGRTGSFVVLSEVL